MRTTIKIRGGLGDSGGYVYAGCFADGVSDYAPAFPPYWSDAHIPRTSSPVRFDYLRVSVWCAPRHRFQAVTYSN
jgi:hypothetical protein